MTAPTGFASAGEFERALLAQRRTGLRRLRFAEPLERLFGEHQAAAMRRRLALVIGAALLLQAIFGLLDCLLMPPALAREMLLLRLVAALATLACFLVCRRPGLPAIQCLRLCALAYAVNGLCVALLLVPGVRHGVPMPYEGLFLLLLFGYGVLGLPLRMVCLGSLSFSLALVLVGWWLGLPRGELINQGLFLGFANLIGAVASFVQEHGRRAAWLDACLLEQAQRRAEAQTESRGRLLAAVSHDLRQPLHAMGLYAEQLGEGRILEPARVRQIGQRLGQSVEQLGRLLHSLLDFSRLSLPGALAIQPVALDLQALAQRLHAELQPQALQQGVRLSCEVPPCWVRSDALLLERILRNLLANALQHAQARQIELAAALVGESVQLWVRDDGRGLSPEQQQRVFEEFQQLDNPGRQAGLGLGLGLAIVRQLAERLELGLALESAPGQGCRFSLRLARCAAVPADPQAEAEALAGRVLLVEDDAASRTALAELLRDWGWRVFEAASPGEALACGEADVLLSDYRLADDCDGLQLIERWRERAGFPCPAILLTADQGAELAERCARLHVRLLGKPLLPVRLRQALNLCLTASRAAAPR